MSGIADPLHRYRAALFEAPDFPVPAPPERASNQIRVDLFEPLTIDTLTLVVRRAVEVARGLGWKSIDRLVIETTAPAPRIP